MLGFSCSFAAEDAVHEASRWNFYLYMVGISVDV